MLHAGNAVYAQAIVSVCLSFIRLLALVSGIGAGDGFLVCVFL